MNNRDATENERLTAIRIRELREGLGFSQRELAKEMDLKQTTISKYEKMQRFPKVETLQKFADAFHVPLDFLRGNGLFSPGSPATEVAPHDLIAQQDMIENVWRTLGPRKARALQHYYKQLNAYNKGLALHSVAVSLKVADQVEEALNSFGLNNTPDKSALLQDRLFKSFQDLNDSGKEEAVKRVEELTEIPRYIEKD